MFLIYFSSKVQRISPKFPLSNAVNNNIDITQKSYNNQLTKTENSYNQAKNQIIIYNRIPKTGSTTFANICNLLAKENKFWNVNLNTTLPNGDFGNSYIWPLAEQKSFLRNITKWKHKQPAIYHGHFSFINPSRYIIYNSSLISYINLVRNPLERLVSYYYFIRYGDDFRPNKIRKNHNDLRSFDQCVQETYKDFDNIQPHRDCGPEKIWMQIPLFCGQFKRCWDNSEGNRRWAYNTAVDNFYKYYSIVGYTKSYLQFFELLESLYPDFFKNASKLIIEEWGGIEKLSLRHTRNKLQPSAKSIEILKNTLEFKYEMMFYQIVKNEFDEQYTHSIANHKYYPDTRVNYNKVYNEHGKYKANFRNS